MSDIPSESISSIDIGVSVPQDLSASRQIRHHPPRLQHSPSLPNIWFPPHSGPIPPQFEDIARSFLRRPSTPPSSMADVSTPTTPPSKSIDLLQVRALGQPQKVKEHRGTLSFDDLSIKGTIRKAQPRDIQRRRRIERDHQHSLLTPPLTPSSSIRTNTSADTHDGKPESDQVLSTTSAADETSDEDTYKDATRFLLLGNISRSIPSNILRLAIVETLTSPLPDNVSADIPKTLSVPVVGAALGQPCLNGDSIKGFFVRCQRTHGIVMLAFFDVRHAVMAKTLLSLRTDGPLEECVEEVADEDTETWITCQFVSAESLAETIGYSAFLASTDGSFYLAVEGHKPGANHDGKELTVVEAPGLVNGEGTSNALKVWVNDGTVVCDERKRSLNIAMLRTMLWSFGEVRSLSLIDEQIDPEQLHAKVFHVEYFDLREANGAYIALDGQVLFGMKLKVFGREVPRDQPHSHQDLEGQHSPQTVLTTNSPVTSSDPLKNIPVPSTPATPLPHQSTDDSLQIGTPGQHSQLRERFLYPEPSPTQPRTRSASAGHDASEPPVRLSPSLAPASAAQVPMPSPTYFYTSPPSDNVYPAAAYAHDRRAANHVIYDAEGKPYWVAPQPPVGDTESLRASFEGAHDGSGVVAPTWEDDVAISNHEPLQYYGPHHDCYYCPSRVPTIPGGTCYGACPTPVPTPSLYYPPQRSPQPPVSTPYPMSPSVAHPFGYDYDTRLSQTVASPVSPHWAFEHAMVLAARPAGTPGEYWYPDAHGVPPTVAAYYSHHMHAAQSAATGAAPLPYYPTTSKQETQMPTPVEPSSPLSLHARTQAHHSSLAHRAHPFSASRTARGAPSTVASTTTAPSARKQQQPPERFQLNLARIEEGQDTRTTVMIKNIPNKMTDKDLIAYISKVCPKRIDFLYLRMDFQNGCNVGYAFVNFITVQDLLSFAKKRLGEKWNMFSSEKVLQMSYADYQGKEACIEKFRNSGIMDERESWRPKIFYSEPGPEQGLLEPFPPPTHLRRKERSSYNRGALFVPGVGRSSGPPGPSFLGPQLSTRRLENHHGRYTVAERQRRFADEVEGHQDAYPTAGATRRRAPPGGSSET